MRRRIQPFRGLRYSPTVAGDLSDNVCPPYDVISSDEGARLAARSAYNAAQANPEVRDGAAVELKAAADALRRARARGPTSPIA